MKIDIAQESYRSRAIVEATRVINLMSEPVVKLATTKPEAEIAAEMKKRITAKLEELCGILNEATDAGFHVAYGTGSSPMGRQIVTQVVVMKHF